ncbi:MAG: hypothetical protein L0216_18090 [Planctomycetales bacterium]|nr:hypothetical protein [Planctomycetales bacterium]
MIVPQFWAEGRAEHREGRRQTTVRRFGWSDASLADAEAKASVRAEEALKRILAGERLPRKERKRPYNVGEGVPIREEIVERLGDALVTRNSYGARCLNTPNVLFADIDFPTGPGGRLYLLLFASYLLAAGATGWFTRSIGAGFAVVLVALFTVRGLAHSFHRMYQRTHGGPELVAQGRIAAFLDRNRDWAFRLYRTPAGLRLLATHRTFRPDDPEVRECFQALGVDRLYAAMCLNQQCFRARVSANPWRIGLADHLRPRPGVWPVAPERMAERRAWVEKYEAAARGHAACRFVEALGSGVTHPDARRVQEWHDQLSRATTELPLA